MEKCATSLVTLYSYQVPASRKHARLCWTRQWHCDCQCARTQSHEGNVSEAGQKGLAYGIGRLYCAGKSGAWMWPSVHPQVHGSNGGTALASAKPTRDSAPHWLLHSVAAQQLPAICNNIHIHPAAIQQHPTTIQWQPTTPNNNPATSQHSDAPNSTQQHPTVMYIIAGGVQHCWQHRFWFWAFA